MLQFWGLCSSESFCVILTVYTETSEYFSTLQVSASQCLKHTPNWFARTNKLTNAVLFCSFEPCESASSNLKFDLQAIFLLFVFPGFAVAAYDSPVMTNHKTALEICRSSGSFISVYISER